MGSMRGGHNSYFTSKKYAISLWRTKYLESIKKGKKNATSQKARPREREIKRVRESERERGREGEGGGERERESKLYSF